MSVRLRTWSVALGACLFPGLALADGLVIPGYGTDDGSLRPSYRDAYNAYPPPQHGLLGQPVPPPAIDARPTYRQAYNDYPPPGGRYGGGIVEYFMTGGRPQPVPAQTYAAPQPAYGGATQYNPALSGLPQGGLPGYAPQPPAGYQPMAYGAPGYDPVAADPGLVTRQMNPIYQRQDVAYDGSEQE